VTGHDQRSDGAWPAGWRLVGGGDDRARWALTYAARGLTVVALHWPEAGECSCRRRECRSQGKHPLLPRGKDDATADPDVITSWWRQWPQANVGVRPPAGVVVLDVDPRHRGASALLDLTRRDGPLTPTLTAATGGRGLHIWYRYHGPTRAFAAGIDVKTNSGYLVAPPSVHLTGTPYQWLTTLPIAPAPRWLRPLLCGVTPVPPLGRGPGRAREGLVRLVETAPEGNRNSALFWAACRVHEQGDDPTLLEDLIRAAVSNGLPEREARAAAASAARIRPRGGGG
jgi:hypothetical protein